MSQRIEILILEDSEDDALLLLRKLAKEGDYLPHHERVETFEGFQAALSRQEWDIIIYDHSMPRFNALQALEELKERRLDVPMIIVSGTIESSAAVAAMKCGASDFIMKEDRTRLVPAIERLLREARSRREKRMAEQQLHHAQRMESIGRLAGGVAHDFNNILTAISGYSYFLLGSLAADDPNRADVEEIKKAGERAAALTRQLLAFSRRQVLKPKLLDLNTVVTGISSMLRRIIGEDLELITTLAGDLRTISADPGQLEQVILNLVVNARDAMPGGGTITITTSNVELTEEPGPLNPDARPGPHVLLAVKDTGCGMDADVLSHLFEPFFTTKAEGKGTGLGLSTVYGIVKQSGGRIVVASEPGSGSTFHVYLPVALQTSEPAAAVPPPVMGSRQGFETVLVVEDDEIVRKFIMRLLAQGSYVLLEARNPEEALRISASHAGSIHLLLTDIVLPGMRGDALAKRLSEDRPDMKIIFTSGYTETNLTLNPEAVFIQKPIDPARLSLKVRELLDRPEVKEHGTKA